MDLSDFHFRQRINKFSSADSYFSTEESLIVENIQQIRTNNPSEKRTLENMNLIMDLN